MKKIIILIAMLYGSSFCFDLDPSKALSDLGDNCRLDVSTKKIGNKDFHCDSGHIYFNFDKKEVFIRFNHVDLDGHKKEVVFSLNRGWTKNKQTHKNKYAIMFLLDEFGEVVYAEELKWSGEIYDLYEDFKEKVIYKKEAKNTTKNNEKYVTRDGWNTDSDEYLHYHEASDGNGWECDDGYHWAENGERCIKDNW